MTIKKPLQAGERVKYTAEFLRRMAWPQNTGTIVFIDNPPVCHAWEERAGRLVRVLWRGENEARPINSANIERATIRAKAAPKPATIEAAPAIVAARPLFTIAREIRRAWPRVYFGAAPYLDAMSALNSINDNYYHDDARGIVRYFLANAATFKGDAAKALKAELKQLLKG